MKLNWQLCQNGSKINQITLMYSFLQETMHTYTSVIMDDLQKPLYGDIITNAVDLIITGSYWLTGFWVWIPHLPLLLRLIHTGTPKLHFECFYFKIKMTYKIVLPKYACTSLTLGASNMKNIKSLNQFMYGLPYCVNL